MYSSVDSSVVSSISFFFNDTATTEIYTLSLHDALPIFIGFAGFSTFLPLYVDDIGVDGSKGAFALYAVLVLAVRIFGARSEEHTSELQSRQYLVCRLLLEKKKNHQRPTSLHVTPLTHPT